MVISELRLIKRCAEFRPREEIKSIPHGTRGIYVLLRRRPRLKMYDVVYVGMTNKGMRGRLHSHTRSKRKKKMWTHFSAFEVWDNIREEEVEELEGLFRHIYRKDTRANRLNRQKAFKKLRRVRENNLEKWEQKKRQK